MSSREMFVSAVVSSFGEVDTITSKQIKQVVEENKFSWPNWLTVPENRVSRGVYEFSTIQNIVPMKKQIKEVQEINSLVPEKDPNYIAWGFHKDLKNIIKTKMFYPLFVFGESGFGKNMMIEQVCAELGRELIRFNFSVETDKTDLLGGPTLVNGNISYRKGPVVEAMENGSVLFLDEIFKGNPNTILALNGILEGKPFYNTHTGELIKAKEGFNIIAASNSSGRGDDAGRFLEQIFDVSFLERFPIAVTQEYPTEKTELKILSNYCEDTDFVEKLVKWARVTRKTYDNGGIDELISIRRLVHILKAYSIFGDKMKAINLCVSRFEQEVKNSFLDLYTKIDSGVNVDEQMEEGVLEEVPDEI